MAAPDLTAEQLASLVWPLYEENDGAIVCDFGGRLDYPDGSFSYVDGPRFRVMPGDVVHGLTYDDLARRLAKRQSEIGVTYG